MGYRRVLALLCTGFALCACELAQSTDASDDMGERVSAGDAAPAAGPARDAAPAPASDAHALPAVEAGVALANEPVEPAPNDASTRGDAGLPPELPVKPAGMDAAVPALAMPVDAGVADASDSASDAASEFVVGTVRVEIAARAGRTLPLQLWYPAEEGARAEASAGHAASEFEPPGPRRMLLERLLMKAPEACANRRMYAAFGAPVVRAAAPYPLLVYSHHLEGMRIALFSLAERLAKLGFIVAAPDHESMTLYDRTDDLMSKDPIGTVLRSRLDALTIRADDIQSVIDTLLDPKATAIPEGLRGRIDSARVGVFGHSMGSMTAGVVAARDARVKAAAFLSYPPARGDLDILGQPPLERLRIPALLMLNQEDAPLNTVGGNDLMRSQFDAWPALSYLVEVADTGHWSFADDCGLIPDFDDGCGQGTRHDRPSEMFKFLDNAEARRIAARYLAEFFASQFLGAPLAALAAPKTSDKELVRIHRPLAGDAGVRDAR